MPHDSLPASSNALTSEHIDALWSIAAPVEGEVTLRLAVTQYPESAEGRFDEAWEALSKISLVHAPRVEIRLQLEKGRLMNSSGKRDDARTFYQRV